nr:MbcA/ParS/Xre antitoxin family protein [Novosphingobium olei]
MSSCEFRRCWASIKPWPRLFDDEDDGVAWLHRQNDAPAFGGHPPLDLIVGGTQDGLMVVRRFLDAARSGLYMQPSTADAGLAPYDYGEIIFV